MWHTQFFWCTSRVSFLATLLLCRQSWRSKEAFNQWQRDEDRRNRKIWIWQLSSQSEHLNSGVNTAYRTPFSHLHILVTKWQDDTMVNGNQNHQPTKGWIEKHTENLWLFMLLMRWWMVFLGDLIPDRAGHQRAPGYIWYKIILFKSMWWIKSNLKVWLNYHKCLM